MPELAAFSLQEQYRLSPPTAAGNLLRSDVKSLLTRRQFLGEGNQVLSTPKEPITNLVLNSYLSYRSFKRSFQTPTKE